MKVRFMVMQNGEEKQLFAAQESNISKDVIIMLPRFASNRFAGNQLGGALNRKISVHNSPNSNPLVKTITHEMTFKHRRPHKGHSVVLVPTDRPFIWPVMCQCVGTATEAYVARSGTAKDEFLKLSAYDAKAHTLTWALIVTNSGYRIPNASGLSVVSYSFNKICINIVYNFADCKSSQSSFDIVFGTSDIVGEGPPIIGRRFDAVEPFHIDELERFLLQSFATALAPVVRRAHPLIITPLRVPQMKRLPEVWQDGISLSEIKYGINSIANVTLNAPGTRMAPGAPGNELLFGNGASAAFHVKVKRKRK